MVDDYTTETNDAESVDNTTESVDNTTESVDNTTESENFDVIYSCLRCNTKVSTSELNRLPEIKCICGFRVFTKVRPPIAKTVKAI